MEPLGRLKCECMFTESSKKLDQLLDALSSTVQKEHHRKAINDAQKALTALRKEHERHVAQYVQSMNRSLVEFSKRQSIMSPLAQGHNGSVLKTSAWNAGSVERSRQPPKKKSKKAAAYQANVPEKMDAESGPNGSHKTHHRRKRNAAATPRLLGVEGNGSTAAAKKKLKKENKKHTVLE